MSNNLRELIDERVSRYADKTFLMSAADGRSWTYREFDHAISRIADLLLSNDIAKGDVVSLLMPNSAEYVIAYFACWKIGAIAGPINSLLKADEIEWLIDNSESKLMLAGSEFLPVIPDIKNPPVVVYDNVSTLKDVMPDEPDTIDLNADDEAIIIYTSGTTGKPKGCLLTHGNLIANAKQIADWMGFGESDRLLTVMPLFHMNAVSVTTMTALYAGGSTVVAQRFSASRFWEIVDKYEVTSFGSVATMLSMLLAKHEELSNNEPRTTNHERLRFAMCGSAPVPTELLRKFEDTFGRLVIEGYGLSESTCRSTFNPPNENRRPGSCGLPIGNEMKIVDVEGNEVPDGELGEIVLRGPNICKGYFKNEEATAQAFRGGWFHTGDIARRDEDGFYYIVDRRSDMIIRGGENIYPREIDDLLYAHPAVAQAAVIGVPDELYGEEVNAFVVLKPDSTLTQSDLINFCRQHLADYKCPKTVYFIDEIPKGPTGKLLKRELAQIYADKLTERRNK